MAQKVFRDLLHTRMTRKEFMLLGVFTVAAASGIVGVWKELSSKASTPTASIEPEAGSIVGGNARAVADTSASSSKAVAFGMVPTDSFVLGTTEPTWANSGSRIITSSLTQNNTTNFITTSDGQVISGLYLPKGRIEVRHKNVIIRDCVINIGYDANRQYIQNNCAIVHNPSFVTSGNLIEYVTVDPINAGTNGTADDAKVSGIYGYSFTARRCALRNVTDGFMPDIRSGMTAPATIEGNYVHTRWLAYDSEQTDGTHNDCVQLAGGNANIIRGNSLNNPSGGVKDPVSGSTVKGQCVVMTPYHGAIDNIVVDKNWLYGSYTQVAAWVPSTYGPQPQKVTITGNRHGGQCVWPILITPAVDSAKLVISGNIVASGGLKWNNGTLAAGAAVNPNIASAG